ncbi:MAG TPA: glycosyltransferase family 2 protein [Tepidisphaeraceae bacterium]|nr:glycosyltransferase family 2 protein [Tepidisphaeraceae bacterium]
MRTLIAIPVHNEQKYADDVLDKVARYHRDVLVIDDGSNDDTPRILAARRDIQVLTHRPNQGYGRSLIDAFCYADAHGYDWVITMDCDEQHEPARIPDFLAEIATDQWDVVSGSRYLTQEDGDDLPPVDRRSINASLTARLNDLFKLNITDAFCGYKAHRVSATVKLGLTEPGYAFPMQLWPRVVKHNLRLKEIPVRLIYNDPSRHFGGQLDDPTNRLKHYTAVLDREIALMNDVDSDANTADAACEASSCCCSK